MATTLPCRRTSTALAVAAVAWLAAPSVRAQDVKETLELTREAVERQRRVLVAGSLPLSDSEADAFWPLYDAYETERRSLDERTNRVVAEFVATAATLSDERAKAMLEEMLKVDEGRLRLRRAYRDRMAKAIAPRMLVRFFQIENKLDSVVRADISRQIPLIP